MRTLRMRGLLARRDRLWIGAGALLAALALLGVLQYRWLREVADAQRARLRADAAARAAAVAQDFDREITRAFLILPVDSTTLASGEASAYAARYEEFRRSARWPGLVRDVYVVEAAEAGRRLRRFSAADRRLVPTAWPAELEAVRARLEGTAAPALLPSIVAGVPALLAPVAEPPMALAFRPERLAGPALARHHLLIRRAHAEPLGAFTVLVLDRGVLTGQLLPAVLARHLSAEGGREFEASVVETEGGARVHGPDVGAGDAAAEMFRLRLEDLDAAILKSFVPDALRREIGERVSVRVESTSGAGGPAGRWRLVLRHPRGSVERAVQAALVRNLALAYSVLAVLAGGVALVVASARRQRALAARQMEFVAAVSHELRTPLAAIRTAGENLADGLVSAPEHVRRYGGIVRDEGLRLSEMVEQVLSFAGAHSVEGERHPVDLAALAERALAAEAREGLRVERRIEPGLPEVLGSGAALERAIANLLSNARKYGGGSARLEVEGVPREAPRAVAVTVSDDGPGIEPAEHERVFEPFFRGRRAREAQAPGSGLGLAIVRRIVEGHGGRVELRAGPGGGASFTLTLPASPAAPEAAASDAQAHPAG